MELGQQLIESIFIFDKLKRVLKKTSCVQKKNSCTLSPLNSNEVGYYLIQHEISSDSGSIGRKSFKLTRRLLSLDGADQP